MLILNFGDGAGVAICQAVSILQIIIRFSKDKRKISFYQPVLRQQARRVVIHLSFCISFLDNAQVRFRAQTAKGKVCGLEQLRSEIGFYVTIALKKIQLT